MKRIFLILLLLIVHYTLKIEDCTCQSGWFLITGGGNNNLRNMYFINESTGWIVSDTSRILKTTNGGINWSVQQIYGGPYPNLYSISFANNMTGYIGGASIGGYSIIYLFKTTNQGNNWFVANSYGGVADNQWISEFAIITPDIIFASTSGQWSLGPSVGDVRKSTNGGTNFASGYGYGAHLSISFINEQTGWTSAFYLNDIGPRKGYILKTTNSGINWITQYKDTISPIRPNKIQFIDNNTGYAVGEILYANPHYTKFLKTTNGGVNWNINSFTNSYKSYSLFFVNANTGWICGGSFGDTSSISKTTNGGENWTSQKTVFQYLSLNNIFFVNSLTGYAIGGSGIILKTTTGGVTFIKQITQIAPDNYLLYQNYPNPFNPSTKIKFDIIANKVGQTFMSVYDIQGREIQTLVNEVLQPGTYEVTFDGSNLSSGVYFYQLRSSDYVNTKKLILLK
ncbi:MAG TPA: T9SS type A sorting domain-containing protein [Ignavibacteria bacterium]